jgi:F0F1-type ATP synthase assembly protein I
MRKMTVTNMPKSTSPGRHTVRANTAEQGDAAKAQFVVAALNMSWQLAAVVLVPIIGGVEIDKAIGSTEVFLFVGLALALIGSIFVMRRAMQAANKMPVPKLTAAQKRAIKKSYEEEDED